MSTITLFTDPHLGTDRGAHTTRQSSARLKQALFDQAMSIVKSTEHPLYCLGDLFDKATNSEATILQGYEVASKCALTIAGNHDLLNREGVVTSLSALKEMGVPICATPDLSTPYFEHHGAIYVVPHHASQVIFEQALVLAAEHAAKLREGLASYLLLHCNYNFNLAVEDNTLNLPEPLAAEIGESFDHIFIGHEHNWSTHLDGKVVVMGNTHPTSYHDLSDKYVYHLDLETAKYIKECVWSMDKRYLEVRLGDPIPDLAGIQFINVVGQEAVGSAAEVSDYINSLWKAGEYKVDGSDEPRNDLLAIRNKVALKDVLDGVDTAAESVQLEDLQTKLRHDLEGSDLQQLFDELLAEVLA